MKATSTPALRQRAGLPASWRKVAGILRGRKSNPLKELKTMRAEWERRTKVFEKRSRA